MKSVPIYMSEDFHTKLKIHVAKKGTSITKLVMELLTKELTAGEK